MRWISRDQRVSYTDSAWSQHQIRVILPSDPNNAGVNASWKCRWPVLVYLLDDDFDGGSGEYDRVLRSPGFRYASTRYVVLSLCCRWNTEDKDELSDWVLEFLGTLSCAKWIDHQRIYLTGAAMGGIGTSKLASRRLEMFAAIAPVVGCDDGLISRQQDLVHLSRELASLPVLLVMFGEGIARGAGSLLPLLQGLIENGAEELQVEVSRNVSRDEYFMKAYCDSAFLFMWLERWRKRHEEPELVADEDRLLSL